MSYAPNITIEDNFQSQVSNKGEVYQDKKEVLESVKKYYGDILGSSSDLKTSACTCSGGPPPFIRQALALVPSPVKEKFYGCGNPIPSGIDGLHVLDLGSGSGRDCYIAAQLVGEKGSVTGVDMTEAQLYVARENLEGLSLACPKATKNIKFLSGFIEDLEGAGVPANAMDLCISNCVVNLSPNKRQVLESVYRALKNGGEFYFSDVYCDRRLPENVRKNELLFGECISGALYTGDFVAMCKSVGFADPRVLSSSPIEIYTPAHQLILGNAKFYSRTYRLFKLPPGRLESQCEDYGQVATYLGTIPYFPHGFDLDDHHSFETNRPVLVCGNTASMLQETWLAPYFKCMGDRSEHFGVFPGCGGEASSSTARPSMGTESTSAKPSGACDSG